MDYKKHYDLLIERAKTRDIDCNVYTEMHHIVPRCIGGTDDKDNLVRLLPEEHLVAHLLLAKVHRNNPKLMYAANMMCSRVANNKEYKWVRENHARNVSEFMSRYQKTDEHKQKIGLAHRGKTVSKETRDKISRTDRSYMKTAEYRQTMSEAKAGFIHSDKTKQLLSDIRKGESNPFYGRTHLYETKQKISEHSKNSKWMNNGVKEQFVHSSKFNEMENLGFVYGRTEVKCPHCGKGGKGGNMKRYHFDKCKTKMLN